ncbi:MAG: Bax inhibitor-1/YccA family protein [Gemmatimonadaceae bacterium]|nr:Bax inhibitor-1/YccA family protein [Gemmatimonadaceae bacterium]MBA3557140.1 Bax inhibitor-1/YccA family protein [Gemmatimonadaceae bacterium]
MGISLPAGTIVRTGAERATLVRRTYSLVFVSVLFTIAGAMFALSQPRLLQAVAAHPFIAMAVTFAPLLLALKARDAFPANIGLVLLFTFVEGVFISPIMYVYGQQQPGLITQAAGLTIGAFGVLTTYAFVSRRDFSAWGSFFMVGLFVLIAVSLANLFFRNPAMDLWLAGITVLVFSGLLVFDTWRIRNTFGPNEYVAAAVTIYLDLLNIFLALLRILGGRRD